MTESLTLRGGAFFMSLSGGLLPAFRPVDLTETLNECGKSGRFLTAAGIVEVIGLEDFAAVAQNVHQVSGRDPFRHEGTGKPCQPQSRQTGPANLRQICQNELPSRRRNPDVPAVFMEMPG